MKNIKWLLVVGLLVIAGWITSYFVVEANSNNQVFRSISHTGANKELFNNYESVYIGKDIKWDGGDSLPLIKEIALIKNDGEELSQSNRSPLKINLYIDETGDTNLHYRDTYENKMLKDAYLPVNDYQLESDRFTLVMEVSLSDMNYEYDLENIQITYEEQGKEKIAELPLKSFIFKN